MSRNSYGLRYSTVAWRLGEDAPFHEEAEPAFNPVLPPAVNAGTLGAIASGTYQVGTATLVAGPPYSGLAAGNYACQFDGISGYIDCGPNGSDISGPITIMAWIKVNTFDKIWQAIVTKGDNSWRVHRNSSGSETPFVGFGTTGLSNVDQAGSRAVNDGQWHHMAAVYDGSTKYIYIDGSLDTSVLVTGSISLNTYSVLIGENAQATGRYFNGSMDEVAIFTNALSAAQILQVYNSGSARKASIFSQKNGLLL